MIISCSLEDKDLCFSSLGSCKPKLDEDTAFRHLDIHYDCRTVEWSNHVVNEEVTLKRFYECRQVLCEDAAPEVACWSVKWESRRGYQVSIAVAYHSIPRLGIFGNCRFGRNDVSWCLERSGSSLSFHHNNCETEIAGSIPSEVGVYLNQKEGNLIFYDLDHDDPKCIFVVQARFTQPLYPGFYVTAFCSVTIS